MVMALPATSVGISPSRSPSGVPGVAGESALGAGVAADSDGATDGAAVAPAVAAAAGEAVALPAGVAAFGVCPAGVELPAPEQAASRSGIARAARRISIIGSPSFVKVILRFDERRSIGEIPRCSADGEQAPLSRHAFERV